METSFFCADSLVLSTSGLIGITPIIPQMHIFTSIAKN